MLRTILRRARTAKGLPVRIVALEAQVAALTAEVDALRALVEQLRDGDLPGVVLLAERAGSARAEQAVLEARDHAEAAARAAELSAIDAARAFTTESTDALRAELLAAARDQQAADREAPIGRGSG
jgi:hypothetical protein